MRLYHHQTILLDFETLYPESGQIYHSEIDDDIVLILLHTLPKYLPERFKNYLPRVKELADNDRKILSLSFEDIHGIPTIITQGEYEVILPAIKIVLDKRLVPIIDFEETKPIELLKYTIAYIPWLKQYDISELYLILGSNHPQAIIKTDTAIYAHLNYSPELCQDGQILFNLQQEVIKNLQAYFNNYTSNGLSISPNYRADIQHIFSMIYPTYSIANIIDTIEASTSCRECPIWISQLTIEDATIKALELYCEGYLFRVCLYNNGFKNGLNENLEFKIPDYNKLRGHYILHYDALWIYIFQQYSNDKVKYDDGIFYTTGDNQEYISNIEPDINDEYNTLIQRNILALTELQHQTLLPILKRYKYKFIAGDNLTIDGLEYTIYKSPLPVLILKLALLFDNLLTDYLELVGR